MVSLYLCPSLNVILMEEGFYQYINGVLKVLLRSFIVPSDQYRPTFTIIWKIFAPKGRVWPKKKSLACQNSYQKPVTVIRILSFIKLSSNYTTNTHRSWKWEIKSPLFDQLLFKHEWFLRNKRNSNKILEHVPEGKQFVFYVWN